MQDNSAASPKKPAYAEWFIGSFLFFASYAILAAIRRNYFNQDDNFTQFGPVILAAARSVFDHGVFPDWNPFQLMGAPLAETGVYALTYPVTYLSAWLAVNVWKDPAAWVDVFFLLHAFPGFLVTMRLLRELKVSEWVSIAASQAFVFCGYNLIIGRSWYYMIPMILWLPLLAFTLFRFAQAASSRWIAVASLTVGIGFHSGNAQMWIYLLVFWLLGAALLISRQPREAKLVSLKAVGIALVIGMGIAAPLFIPQFQFASEMHRQSQFNSGIGRSLLALIFPHPIAQVGFPDGWWPDPRGPGKLGQMFYAGTVFTLCALAATFFWLRDKQRTLTTPAVFLILGWLAFWLSLGKSGGLWSLLGFLPPFNKFDHPFKFLPFLHFFWIIAGAVFLEQRWAAWEERKKIRARFGVALLSILLVGYHLTQANAARYLYGDVTYPPYPHQILDLLQANAGPGVKKYRVDTMSPRWDPYRGYLLALRHNFATYYGITMLDGYDPLVGATTESHVFSLKMERDQANGMKKAGVATQMVYRDARLLMGKIDNPDPMAFALENTAVQFPYDANFSGLEVTNPQNRSSKKVVLNYLARPRLRAWVDDVKTSVEADDWGRMVIPTPNGWKKIYVVYSPPWEKGFLIGLLLVAVGLGLSYRTGVLRWMPD